MGGFPRPVVFSGGSGYSQDSGVSPDDVSEEEDLFDLVVEEVAGYEPTDDVSKRNPPQSRLCGIVCCLP